MIESQWKNKTVAFLGDSITDPIHVGTTKNYWQFLEERLGLQPLVYGVNGHRWINALGQAEKLYAERGDRVDAIFVFLGTNDYNGSVPPGDWFYLRREVTNANGTLFTRPRRILNTDPETLRGRINQAMSFLREKFPVQQIVLMTPIHRAFATFGDTNVQPDESFPNALGFYLEHYVEIIREAADLWSCPLIDLYRRSGLHPLTPSQGQFFHDPATDRLHPNAAGHRRIAETMLYAMLTLPADFR